MRKSRINSEKGGGTRRIKENTSDFDEQLYIFFHIQLRLEEK